MPWTFVHPAAVLPLRKSGLKRLSFAGLVVGSLAPDIGYYVGRFDLAAIAHTSLGLLLLCLPTGLILYVLVRMLHRPVANMLPEPHRSALLSVPRVARLVSLPILVLVAVSIILGAMTHNAWDSFTHPTGYMVARVPWLRESVGMLGNGNVCVCDLLQHASTLCGLVVLAAAYVKWLRRSNVSHAPSSFSNDRWRYALLFALLAAAAILGTPLAYELYGETNGAVRFVRVIICATSIFAVALSAVALLLWGREKGLKFL
jgi:hypothetical protein